MTTPTPEDYGRYASLCGKMANIVVDDFERKTLLSMEAQWHRLADHKEKRTKAE